MCARERLVPAKANKKAAMKASPNLPQDDLDALVAYVQTLKK